MSISFRAALKSDLAACTDVRSRTRDNAFSRQDLEAIGVTEKSWSLLMDAGTILGFVAEDAGQIVGFGFGDTDSGEVLVVAVLEGYEGKGMGSKLLSLVGDALFAKGHAELWLAASATPVVRAYGFYRKVGWHPTGRLNDWGDEILTLAKPAGGS